MQAGTNCEMVEGTLAAITPDILSLKEGGPIMDEARQGPEPGHLGMMQKTISFRDEDLQEYKRLVNEGVVEINFPNFVRQSVAHELARYRAQGKHKGGKKQ